MSGPVLRLLALLLVLLQLILLVELKKGGKGLGACLAKNKLLKNRYRCFNEGQKKQARSFQRIGNKKRTKRTATVKKNERFNNINGRQYNQMKRFKNQRKVRGHQMLQREKKLECPRRKRRGNKRQV